MLLPCYLDLNAEGLKPRAARCWSGRIKSPANRSDARSRGRRHIITCMRPCERGDRAYERFVGPVAESPRGSRSQLPANYSTYSACIPVVVQLLPWSRPDHGLRAIVRVSGRNDPGSVRSARSIANAGAPRPFVEIGGCICMHTAFVALDPSSIDDMGTYGTAMCIQYVSGRQAGARRSHAVLGLV
jgi:hypothetical protein